MQSGVYDGLILFPATWFGFKFHEVAPYWTEMGWGAMAVYIMTVNLKRFSSLPKEIQSILIEEGRNWEAENAKEGVRRHAIGLKKLREAGATVRRLPRKAQIDMARALRDWPDSKAKELDKAGFPGTAIFRRYIELAKKSGVEFPVDYPIR